MDDDERWEMWRTWLGDDPTRTTIYGQVAEMIAFRQVWDVFAYMHREAPEGVREEQSFYQWFRVAFARSQALGVRRMADQRPDVISLARLIDDVRRNPTVLSRARFLATRGNPGGLAEGWFDDLARMGDHIDPRVPAEDRDKLQSETKVVVDWVNKAVAHLDHGRPKEAPPLQDVHDAVDVVTDLFRKYNQLIMNDTALHDGVMMDYWPNAFRFPWIADDDAYQVVLAQMDEAERRRTKR